MKNCNGSIDSIETLGLLDGPGIRVVVFLKGCKLRCLYCHNPEMWTIGNYNYTAEQLVTKILKYKTYFKDNGGVTFSGGEPLMQPEFLLECCKLLKYENINIVLDTSGVGFKLQEEILKYVDLVILDIKHIDEIKYRKLTNYIIEDSLSFIELLNKSQKKVWIRQVIIPNINDNKEYINNFKQFIKKIKNVEKVEFLPYHKLGDEKYKKLNINNPLKDIKAMDKDKLNELHNYFIGDENMKNIYTIGAPMKYGCNVIGADLGIDKLKEIPFDEILEIKNIDKDIKNNMKYIDTIVAYDNQLASIVHQQLDNGKTVITIGGDHSLAVGSIAGSSSYNKIGVLWVDSHGDINNENVTLTGNVHGFPLASCFGLGPKVLNECYNNNTKVDKENIVIFGCSDLDDSELKIIFDNDLKVYLLNDVKNDFKANILEAVLFLKNKVDKIHLSLDLDSINPNIMTAVNVKSRANDGLNLEQIYELIDIIFDNISVQSIDIVEFNPLNDVNDFCRNEVVKIYNYIVNKILEKS